MIMRDLKYFRPDYVIAYSDAEVRCPEAHRVVRNAIAVAQVLRPVLAVGLSDALTAIENLENDVEGPRVLTPGDASALATVLEEVSGLLETSFDQEGRPHGLAAKYILEEADLPSTYANGAPDPDRVFEMMPDGRASLQSSRMSLYDLRERLPDVAAFLRQAGEQGNDVMVDD